MKQPDNMIEMLSERRADSKLKSITREFNPDYRPETFSVIRFIFEGEVEGEERHIEIFGDNLSVGFGRVKLD